MPLMNRWSCQLCPRFAQPSAGSLLWALHAWRTGCIAFLSVLDRYRPLSLTHTHTRASAVRHARHVYLPTPVHPAPPPHTHTQSRAHTHTRTHTHSHAHTHTVTHTPVLLVPCMPPPPAAPSPICKQLQCATGGIEITASTRDGAEISSGGGFSVYSPRPVWQNAVRSWASCPVCALENEGEVFSDDASLSTSMLSRFHLHVKNIAHDCWVLN
jgi:hypothetical protein